MSSATLTRDWIGGVSDSSQHVSYTLDAAAVSPTLSVGSQFSSSALASASSYPSLVDGAIYNITLSWRDAAGNPPAVFWRVMHVSESSIALLHVLLHLLRSDQICSTRSRVRQRFRAPLRAPPVPRLWFASNCKRPPQRFSCALARTDNRTAAIKCC